jgi:hypothetical protein
VQELMVGIDNAHYHHSHPWRFLLSLHIPKQKGNLDVVRIPSILVIGHGEDEQIWI